MNLFSEAIAHDISREMNRLSLLLLMFGPEWGVIPASSYISMLTRQIGSEAREAVLKNTLDHLRCIKQMFNAKGPYIMDFAPEDLDRNIYFLRDGKILTVCTSNENEVTVAFWVLEQ